jgi:DNA mismatch repair protein MutS2
LIQSETLELLEWSRLCQHLSTFAATKLGSVAARNLQIPASQLQSEELLAQTKEVYDLESLTTGLSFDGIQDIGDSLARAQLQGILAGNELLGVATTLFGARQLRRYIDNQTDIPVLTQLVSELRTYPELEQEIHRCIDERGQVTDRSSPILGDLRTQIKQLRTQINRSLQNILQRHSNAVQEQIITSRGDRFVIPVKAPQKDAIPGIVHDTSTSGATLYVEPSGVVPLGNQLRQLVRKEQVEEEAIRRTLTKLVADVSADLERLLAIATIIDLATARARYSFWLKANPPRFINRSDESINLRQLRHPLLVWQQQHEQDRLVVPVDLFIQPNIRVVTITGPNTGGKTVTLKTLGLAALMAKVGLFIPAREPVEIPWFEQILTDIGDEQSLEQSLSTFSGHIRRISRILTAIDESESSLVLLDEVGAGTDPVEGSAIAIALLQYLANNAQLSIATTHFGELKALKYEDDRFENASVEFDEISLSPTYRLLWGIPGRSNALTIAQRLGLKTEVIEAAKNYTGGANDDVNQVIAGLEAQRKRQETKATEAQKLLEQAERFYQEVSAKAASLQARERELRASQDVAVQNAISEAKGEIAQVIRRLQQGTVTSADAQQATNDINQIAAKYVAPPPKPKAEFKPQVGDRIRIPRLGQTAEVLSAPSDDGDLMVRFGIMKMTVKLEDIESLDGEKPVPKKKKPAQIEEKPPETTPAPVIRTSKNTVDLRGLRVAEAERILDDAISTAIGQLWIIHGHGTGKLRQGVRAFLHQHPRISRYEDAEKADGGSGVTIAYLG